MEKKDKNHFESYVRINHEYETADEMAENLGIESSKVRSILTKFNLRALKPSEKKVLIAKEQLPERKRISWSESIREAESLEKKQSYIREINKPKVVRAPGIYNQIGSPYGIADQLKGLKLKR